MARRRKDHQNHDLRDSVGGFFGGTRGQSKTVTSGINDRREIVEYQSAIPDGSSNQTEFFYRTTRVEYPRGTKQRPDTYYEMEKLPVFPNPQLIENMPYQVAGFNDRYNDQGKTSTAGELRYNEGLVDPNQTPFVRSNKQLPQFLRQVDTVIINPKYKIPELGKVNTRRAASARALRKGNRQTAFRYAESADNLLAHYASVDESMRRLAKANSAYFGKNIIFQHMPEMGYLPNTMTGRFDKGEIKVDKKKTAQYNEYLKKGYENKPLPKTDFANEYFRNVDYGKAGFTFAGKQYDPTRTLRLDVEDEWENLGSGRLATFQQDTLVNKPMDPRTNKKWWRPTMDMVPGSEANKYDSLKPTTPLQAWMSLNSTLLKNPSLTRESAQKHTDAVSQHEFGHAVLGLDHSSGYNEGYGYSDKNTRMSYDNRIREYGVTLLPSDINYIKQVQSGLKNQAALQVKAFKAAEISKEKIKKVKKDKKNSRRK